MVLLPKGTADRIRATGSPVSGYIAAATLAALERPQEAPGGPETAANAAGDTDTAETHDAPSKAESARETGVKWYGFPADMVAEMEKYGDPAEMFFQGALAIMEEYRAGIR